MSLFVDVKIVRDHIELSVSKSRALEALARIAAELADRDEDEAPGYVVRTTRGAPLCEGTTRREAREIAQRFARKTGRRYLVDKLQKGEEVAHSYLHCCVCGTPRNLQVREACGHDTDGPEGRRWYCSRMCFETPPVATALKEINP